jgi:coatomer subunit beta'
VKSVELHPTEPWVLCNLYSGSIYVYNTQTQALVTSFEVTELPVRTAKFVARKQWIVCGADDMFIRVYNYNTMDRVRAFEAHADYIRCVAPHPTLPYLLSSSDDMLIKLWDWDKNWACTQIFEGHSHYVMQVTFNPKDTNTFASASLDRTVKVWSLGSPVPNFTLEDHEKGVNCVDYCSSGDRPYLISGADDKLVKVWDYQTKSCVQTLEGHTHNVSSVLFHPELPVIVTGSEDGTVRVWHSTTYRLENTLNYGLERVWSLAGCKGSNSVAIGYDEGTVMIKIGREDPVASMDVNGKIVWARHNEVQTVNVKSLPADYEISDGERLPLAIKELGSTDLYPQSLQHNPNGRFVVVCGDGEYVIYTALAWRNKCFGTAHEFVWGTDNNTFAVRESSSMVRLYQNFKETRFIRPAFPAEGLHGGALIAVRSQDFVVFYDWMTCSVVRRIDVECKAVYWSENGEQVVIAGEDTFYILRYDASALATALASGAELDDDGVEDSFELLHEVNEKVRTGVWLGDCFVYSNASWRLNYTVGGEVTTIYHLDRPMYILGYMAAQNRLYLIDKEYGIVTYKIDLSLIEYKTLVMRGDMEAAAEVLPAVPTMQLDSVAHFLEARGEMELALDVAQDADYRFDLAIQLGRLDVAMGIAEEAGSENKWKQLGDLALSAGKLQLSLDCMRKAGDLSGQLLLLSSFGDAEGVRALRVAAEAKGKTNVAFVCLLLLGEVGKCVELLETGDRVPEAAFMARAYAPGRVSEMVGKWKSDLHKVNSKAAEALADPAEYPNLFDGLTLALEAERGIEGTKATPIAAAYKGAAFYTSRDLLTEARAGIVPADSDPDNRNEAEMAAGEGETISETRGAVVNEGKNGDEEQAEVVADKIEADENENIPAAVEDLGAMELGGESEEDWA